MKPVICPSCGHEIYDKSDKCPFCGTSLPRRSIFAPSNGPVPFSRVKVFVFAGLMLSLGIGAFTFYMVMQSTEKGEFQVNVSDQVDTAAEECRANMYSILSAEEEYMDEYGHYTDNIEELTEFDSSLDPVCPESNTPYNTVITKQNIQISCPVHGTI